MAVSSSSFNTAFAQPKFMSLLSQRFRSFHPWRPHLAANPKLPAIFTPKSRSMTVRVNACYKKRPMDTPGAYELIDEESGEKVILWGGVDDVEPSIPSKKVLSWTPSKDQKKSSNARENIEGSEPSSAHKNVRSSPTTLRLSKGVGRLKAVKIKSIVRKTSREKEKINEHRYEEPDMDELDDDDDDDPIVSSDPQGVWIRKKNISAKSGIEQLMENKLSRKPFEPKDNLTDAGSYVSATHSRGWNDREPRRGYRGESRDLKPTRKYNAGSDFFSRKSFRESGCGDEMIEALRVQDFVRPSNIQAMAYSPVVEGKSCIIADQSGSGKTLAYLAPVIQRLRQEEIEGISKSASKSPRAVILVPTAELASQVLLNCRSISKHGVPFRSMVATGGFRQRTQLQTLEQDLDVLIATPGRFMYLIKEGFLHLTNLRCAVLDEVDILYSDEDFEQALHSLINTAPVTTQYLFVTATLPVEIYNKLVETFPDSEVIMGPGMHRTSSGLEEVLVDCSGNEGSEKTPETAFSNKKSALLRLAEEIRVSRTIIFCNKIETCRKVENALRRLDRKENQIRVLPFHAALEQETRITNMKEFLNSKTENRSLFLICTDRASRGIDFPSVDHVVLFDFPRDPSEYVRRVGRTARGAGGIGKAFVFVVGKQVSLARRIIERNEKGHPLHEVPSAYELVR
ncbi:DEAD-box ATP-dependent RNA helicase 50-like [Chenopodium quinoa]|uniref:DEAD-box ATP-dependent RNA helicase 50-like n=1 Tax=Chenopodium quinoa TaxID=63459 RepID=UPI000B776ED9|nr:DEAD-box ATP-dependent RNA helicase 50-like [Chenopodium quinoa]